VLSPLSSPAPRRAAGTGLSAALHLAAVAVIIFGLPDFKRPAESATVIPVEFVTLPEPQPQLQPPPPPPPPPKPAIAEAPPQEPTKPPPPTLEDVRPDKANKGEKPDKSNKAEETDSAPQEAKRPDPSDETVGKPDDSKTVVIGRWLLDPLTVKHTGHPCGDATENGTLELTGERGPGQFHGTLRTHVHWTRCPPQVASYYVELRIKGNTVLMVGSGFADQGTKNGDIMSLRDAYGTSVWRRQTLPAAKPQTNR
jgi:hypothetical protein